MRTIFRDNYDPVPNEYHEKIVIDEARNKQWLFDCDGIFTDITGSGSCVVNEKGDSTSCAVSQKLFTDETNQIVGEINEIQNSVAGKQDSLTTTQMEAVNSGANSTNIGQITTNANSISAIEGKIPSAASSENQLADKNFVNSSISTNTATFRGTYNLVTELGLTTAATESQIATALATTIATVENNDYCFVQIPTSDATPTEIARIDRYKFNGTAWEYEYSLNNSSFTAAQWAAINSGVTSSDVSKLAGIAAGAEVNVQSNWNETDANSDAYIQNKPTIPAAQVNSDWNATSGVAEILNKPTIPTTFETIFYADANATSTTRYLYKEAAMSTKATMQDLIDANDKGQVIVRTTTTSDPTTYTDSYLQNAWVASGDYQMLFLDERKYSEYSTSTASSDTFTYSTRAIQDALTAGSNVQINGTTISATDTTYSAFTGTDGTAAGTAGLVPAPATTDAGKYLKADGTWASIIIPQSGIPTDATFWGASYDSVNNKVDGTLAINPTNTANKMELSVGGSGGNGTYLQIKNGSETRYTAIRLYRDGADLPSPYSVSSGIEIMQAGIPQSLGQGVFVNGIAVPRTDYQAANKKYVDTQVASHSTMNGAGAPTTSTTGTVGQFYLDTTNDQMYYLAAITPQGTTPETYEYTWETVGGGGGIPTDATFWGASYDTTNNKVNGTMTFDDGAGHTATIVKAAGWSGQRASLNFGANAPTYLGNTQGTYVSVDGSGSNGISLITGNNQITFRSNLISLSSSNDTNVNLNNRSKIVNLKDPTAAQDAATKSYVDTTAPTITMTTTDPGEGAPLAANHFIAVYS